MPGPARADPRSQLLALQRSAGNQAVIGLLRETATEPPPVALFAGDAHKEIHEALDGFNDVPRAMAALKGHDDGQRAQIKKAFEDEYHVKLADYLYDQLDGADLVRAFALLESSHLNDPSTALGLALIPIGTRDEEILRVLEGSKLDGRKKIEEAYDQAFGAKARPGGLMKGSLRADLEDDLSGWRKEKAVTLLDRELSRADHLYFVSVAIAGTHDDSVIAIVQEAWDAGPAEFATLEADWAAHYKPDLRTAMREELSLEAWLLVKAVLDASDRVKKGELSEEAPKELEEPDRQKWLEQDARLAAAKASAKAATTGEDAWYEGAGTNEEQLDKAIETIRTVWQERIDKAVQEKRYADAAEYRNKQRDAAKELHLGEELSGADLQKAELLTAGALTDADEVYLASRDLDTEKIVALVTKAWAAGKMDQLLADAAKERSDAGGVRPSFTVNMTLPIGGAQWDRVNWLSRADHDDATRGANRLAMELDEGNSGSDLAKALALLTAAKPELRAKTVAKFAELRNLPGEGDADTRLLDYVDRRYEKVEEAVALRDLLKPAKTAQEQYDRAKARMEASKTGLADELLADWIRDYDTISGEQTQAVTAESLERLKFLAQQASAKDVARIAAQRGIKGPDALGQIAKMEYGDFKARLAEAEAVEGAIVEALTTTLELVVSAALTAATGGAAGGLLVASLSSAVAGMLAREALMGDKYDLLSKENAQKIAGIVAGASFGALAGELMQGAQSLEKMGRVGAFVQEATQEAFSQIGTTTIGLAFDEKAPSAERIAAGAMNMLVGTVAAGSAGSIRFKLEDAAPFAEQLRVRFAASMTAGTMNMLSEQSGEILKQGGMRDMTGPELLGQVGQKGFEAAKAAMIQSLGEIGAASKRVADEQHAAEEEAKEEEGKKPADEEAGELNAPGGRKPGPHEPHLEDWPEGLVHYGLDEAGAQESYRASVDTDPSREAAIWFDPSTGERLVVQGGEAFVSGSWLSEPEFKGRPWRIVEHFHPGDADVAKFASPADFRAMMMSQLHGHEEPVAVKSDIRYKDAQGREHVTEFGYDPEFGYWLGMKDEHGRWDVRFYDDEPWSSNSKYRDFLAEKGLVTQPARTGGGGVESAGAAYSTEAVRERVAAVREKYGEAYGGVPEFEKLLARVDKTAAKRPEEAAASLDELLAWIERAEYGTGQPNVYDPGDEAAQPLDERDKPGGKLPTTDRRRPSTQLAERMEKIYGPRPEGHDAHHIVAESDPRGGLARKILLAVGIDVNDGINGAYLPGVRGDIVREGDLKHGNVHTNAYYQEITIRLAMSDDIPATLREIHNELLSNKDGLGTRSTDTFPEWAEAHRDTLRSRNIDDADIDDLIEATTRR